MYDFNLIKDKIRSWNNLSDARLIYQEFCEHIENDDELKKIARIRDKRYPFKEIIDEYSVLLEFAKLYFTNNFVDIKYNGNNQTKSDNYDGEFRLNGDTIKVEVTTPIDGLKIHRIAEQINSRGYSKVENGDCYDYINMIKEIILRTAYKKSQKNYVNCILVIYSEEFNFFVGLSDILDKHLRSIIIQSLIEIEYTAQEVYLLIPKYISSSITKTGELIKIK